MSVAVTGTTMRRHMSGVWGTVLRWKARILYAFADQAFYSAANFLLTILYASWLTLNDFGTYVIVWTIALFVEAIQISLVIDSLPAIISRYGRRGRQRIDSAAFWLVVGFSVASSLLLAGGAAAMATINPTYAAPLLILALINPLQRLYLFFRRLCYIRDRQVAAAAGALAYGIAIVAGALALHHYGALSVATAISLLGLGSLAAIATIAAMGIGRLSKIRPLTTIWLAGHVWQSSRWLTPAAVVSWIINWGMFPLVAAISGPGPAGIIRALQNLLTPIVQFNSALNLALLPRVADKVADLGDAYARKFAIQGTAIFSGIVIVYCGVILATASIVLPVLYKKPEIAAASHLLWPLALAIVFEAMRIASSMSLLAMRRTRVTFLARLISLVSFTVAAAILSSMIGFTGILWANACGSAAGAAVVVFAALSLRPRVRPRL